MKVQWKKDAFVRCIHDESFVWCPRTGGCTILQDARPILEEVTCTWREEREIIAAVATKFDCDIAEVSEDVHFILAELASQGFLAYEGWRELGGSSQIVQNDEDTQDEVPVEDDSSPKGDFCWRHGIPADLHIDLTNACTERCVHCYVPQNQHDFLPYEMAEKALREFRALNGLSVHLTGGEAMLHPEFERICRLCVELNLNFLVFSNMTLCDEKRISFLKEVDPQFINVSLYSMEPAEHDAVTSLPGSWKKTMAALLACEKAGVHCRIATPLLKENQAAFSGLKKFATEHRMHLIPSCDIVSRSDHNCSNLSHTCTVEELDKVLFANKALFDEGWDGKMLNPDAKVCSLGAVRLYLNAKGDYYPCDCMHGYVLGNVREHSLVDIWTGEKLNYLRGLKNRDFGECAACERRPWCKVCPAANFNATGDLFRHHPNTCVLASVVREVYGEK